jgi:hypothetical protein
VRLFELVRECRVIRHAEADIFLEPVEDAMQRVHVRVHDPEAHIWVADFETSLPRDVAELYLAAHGPAGLCASLFRLEEEGEFRDILRFATLPFVHEQNLSGRAYWSQTLIPQPDRSSSSLACA